MASEVFTMTSERRKEIECRAILTYGAQMRRDMETASHQLIVRLKQIMGGESE